MKRRTLLQGAGAFMASAVAAPSLVRAEAAATLRFIPQQDLVTLDPVTTFAYITRNHGYMVFDTLYGMDGAFRATPQMVEGPLADRRYRVRPTAPGVWVRSEPRRRHPATSCRPNGTILATGQGRARTEAQGRQPKWWTCGRRPGSEC